MQKKGSKILLNKILKYITIFILPIFSIYLGACTRSNVSEIKDEPIILDRNAPYHRIDISHHNGNIDWVEVSKNSTIKLYPIGYKQCLGYSNGGDKYWYTLEDIDRSWPKIFCIM